MLVSVPRQSLGVTLSPFPFAEGNSSVSPRPELLAERDESGLGASWAAFGAKAAEFGTHVPGAGAWAASGSRRAEQGAQPRSGSALAAQPVPSLPLQGVVLQDRGAPGSPCRGFSVLCNSAPSEPADTGAPVSLVQELPLASLTWRVNDKLEGALAAAKLLRGPFLCHW